MPKNVEVRHGESGSRADENVGREVRSRGYSREADGSSKGISDVRHPLMMPVALRESVGDGKTHHRLTGNESCCTYPTTNCAWRRTCRYISRSAETRRAALSARWLSKRSLVLRNWQHPRPQTCFLDQKIHRTWCLHESLNSGLQCAWNIWDPIPIPSAAPTNMSDDQ
jgi:hypothetical protein